MKAYLEKKNAIDLLLHFSVKIINERVMEIAQDLNIEVVQSSNDLGIIHIKKGKKHIIKREYERRYNEELLI